MPLFIQIPTLLHTDCTVGMAKSSSALFFVIYLFLSTTLKLLTKIIAQDISEYVHINKE